MKDHLNGKMDGENGQPDEFGSGNHAQSAQAQTRINGHTRAPAVGFWVAVDLLIHRWIWLALGALAGTGAFFLLGSHLIKPKFTASAQLLRYESPAAKDFFQSTPMAVETFAGLISSPDLLRRVGTNVSPSIPPEKLIKRIKVDPQSDSDIVFVPYDEAYEEGFEDMPRRVPDISKVSQLVGFRPEMNLDGILKTVIDYQSGRQK